MDERILWTAAFLIAAVPWTFVHMLVAQSILNWTFKHEGKWWSVPTYIALEFPVVASWVGILIAGLMSLFDIWST